MRSALIAAALLAAMAPGQTSGGPITYNIVDYPVEQDGATLSGTITTTDRKSVV